MPKRHLPGRRHRRTAPVCMPENVQGRWGRQAARLEGKMWGDGRTDGRDNPYLMRPSHRTAGTQAPLRDEGYWTPFLHAVEKRCLPDTAEMCRVRPATSCSPGRGPHPLAGHLKDGRGGPGGPGRIPPWTVRPAASVHRLRRSPPARPPAAAAGRCSRIACPCLACAAATAMPIMWGWTRLRRLRRDLIIRHAPPPTIWSSRGLATSGRTCGKGSSAKGSTSTKRRSPSSQRPWGSTRTTPWRSRTWGARCTASLILTGRLRRTTRPQVPTRAARTPRTAGGSCLRSCTGTRRRSHALRRPLHWILRALTLRHTRRSAGAGSAGTRMRSWPLTR